MKGALVTLMLTVLLTLTSTSSDPPQVICPTQPVEAVEGEDVPLRCHLDPEVNLSSFTVDWKRVDLNKIVYSYRHQKEDHGDQLAWYRNRTFMNHEALSRGNLTLLLSSVQQNDSATYRCFVPKWRISCTITLSVVMVRGAPPAPPPLGR